MGRQIIFRGKCVNGEWVHGDLLHIDSSCLIYFGSSTETETPDIPNESKVAVELFGSEVAVVISSTIGQFTGFYDCKGKEIYEGDIIQIDFDTRSTIEIIAFKNGRFVTIDPDRPYRDESLNVFVKYASVIGNIYDPKPTPKYQ